MKCSSKDKIVTFLIEKIFHFVESKRPFSCIYFHINHGNEGGIQYLLLHVEFDARKCMFTFGWGTMVVTQAKHMAWTKIHLVKLWHWNLISCPWSLDVQNLPNAQKHHNPYVPNKIIHQKHHYSVFVFHTTSYTQSCNNKHNFFICNFV
jgi:hypothetical protein